VRVDVVFDQDRDAVQRSARATFLSLAIECGGNRFAIRIELDDGV
jgi:hypothetical protein